MVFNYLKIVVLKYKYQSFDGLLAGIDEAGRGCLAGPVFAAAVILPSNFRNKQLNDSKKLSKKKRTQLKAVIEERAVAWAVGMCSPREIERWNILNASFRAMHRAIKKLGSHPQLLLIDGNRFLPYKKTPHECIIGGDGIYACIAAASILAKTHRDAYMEKQARKFPMYGWQENKGYPTAFHRAAVVEHGQCVLHRKTFQITDPAKQSSDIDVL